jgi:hypothetical protein
MATRKRKTCKRGRTKSGRCKRKPGPKKSRRCKRGRTKSGRGRCRRKPGPKKSKKRKVIQNNPFYQSMKPKPLTKSNRILPKVPKRKLPKVPRKPSPSYRAKLIPKNNPFY